MSKMTQHGIVTDCRTAAAFLRRSPIVSATLLAAANEIERLRDELVRIQTDRPFVMGFNQGWDAAVDSGEADANNPAPERCTDYQPDITSQSDCINCGQSFERHVKGGD